MPEYCRCSVASTSSMHHKKLLNRCWSNIELYITYRYTFHTDRLSLLCLWDNIKMSLMFGCKWCTSSKMMSVSSATTVVWCRIEVNFRATFTMSVSASFTDCRTWCPSTFSQWLSNAMNWVLLTGLAINVCWFEWIVLHSSSVTSEDDFDDRRWCSWSFVDAPLVYPSNTMMGFHGHIFWQRTANKAR